MVLLSSKPHLRIIFLEMENIDKNILGFIEPDGLFTCNLAIPFR